MTDMREAVARAIWEAGANASTTKWENASHDAKLIVYQKADAALSLMQPEIDRRVNAAIATMFERLRTPSEGMIEAVQDCGPIGCCIIHEYEARGIIDAVATAFQQENSDDRFTKREEIPETSRK